MRVAHLAIDGSVVTITAPALNHDFHATSIGVYTVNGHWQEFTTGSRDFGEAVADDIGLTLTESYAFQGGALRLGTASVQFPGRAAGDAQTDLVHLGVWEGNRFSVHTHLYNGSAHDLISIFDLFEIIEDPLGLHLQPRDPDRTSLAKEPSLLREVPYVGLLQVRPMTRRMARTVPRWRGTAAAGGELFVGRRPGSLHLVLAGAGSHTLIMRDGDDCGKEDLSHILRLDVGWRPATR